MPVGQSMDLQAASRVAMEAPLVFGGATLLLLLGLAVVPVVNRPTMRRLRVWWGLPPGGEGPGSNPSAGPPSTWRPFGRRHVSRRVNQTLIEECAAFLDGSYVTQIGALDGAGWLAWLSHLAHADRDHLEARAVAFIGSPMQDRFASWPGAMSFLAKALLARSRSAADLESLQRAVLVPLELDLLSRRGPDPGPEALSRMVLWRLEQQQRHQS